MNSIGKKDKKRKRKRADSDDDEVISDSDDDDASEQERLNKEYLATLHASRVSNKVMMMFIDSRSLFILNSSVPARRQDQISAGCLDFISMDGENQCGL